MYYTILSVIELPGDGGEEDQAGVLLPAMTLAVLAVVLKVVLPAVVLPVVLVVVLPAVGPLHEELVTCPAMAIPLCSMLVPTRGGGLRAQIAGFQTGSGQTGSSQKCRNSPQRTFTGRCVGEM